jgi:DNA adenine methylase
MNFTPLRYPGGKSVMSTFITDLINENSLKEVIYAEPYAGGAGAAINLLLNEKVERIIINDISIGIYSFWRFLKENSNEFIDLLEKTPVTLDEWQKQRLIFQKSKKPSIELAFATFYLSRTNRSGILNAGPMGGQDPILQAKSEYKLDCRFKKEELLDRINKIIRHKKNIEVFNLDAISFLKTIKKNRNQLIYLDPPYYEQGKALYLNSYKHKDHVELSDYLRNETNLKWILSYDNHEKVRDIYSDFELYEFNLLYTAQSIKKGSELFTHSNNLKLPKPLIIKRQSKNIPLKRIN